MKDTALLSTSNRILSALEPDELDRLRPHFIYREVRLGDHLFVPGSRIDHLFFPNDSITSLVGHTAQGRSAEVGLVGGEGAVGIDLLLGTDTAVNTGVIQLAGSGFYLSGEQAREEFRRGGTFQATLLRYMQSLMIQISQTAVCNALHDVEERLARWLLMSRDRSPTDVLPLTQEFLSFMVGSTRATVTLAAITLQDLGLITYRRGVITIADRSGLRKFACDCYRVVSLGKR